MIQIPGSFDERLGIPFAAGSRRREEVAAVDVNRPRHLADRVHHRVDDVAPEPRDVADPERAGARRHDRVRVSPPEEIIFAAREDSDHRPHAVVVRLERHPRRPGEVEDGQIRPAV